MSLLNFGLLLDNVSRTHELYYSRYFEYFRKYSKVPIDFIMSFREVNGFQANCNSYSKRVTHDMRVSDDTVKRMQRNNKL